MFHLTGGASLNRGPNLDTAKKGAKEISRIFP